MAVRERQPMKICAIDEVGCASLSGPVFVCAVIVDSCVKPVPGIADSKQLTKKKREVLFPAIEEAVDDFAYGAAGPRKIEELNIHHAKLLAMRQAVEKLLARGHHPKRTIVDGGFTVPGLPLYINQEAVPKADRDFWEVSAASILAKVTRDRLMANLASRPGLGHYDWENNAGYYTAKHRDGIVLHGLTAYHRKTFDMVKYCAFLRAEYKECLEKGDPEEYFEEESRRIERFGSGPYCGYRAWKRGEFNTWKPVMAGSEDNEEEI